MKFLKYNIVLLLNLILVTPFSFSQSVTKVLISGTGGQHDTDVQTAFEIGYASHDGSNFTGTITKYFDPGILSTLNYAKDNGYEVVIRSTTGLVSAITYASSYPEVQVFMPAGSNTYELVFSGDIESCPIIITGAGDINNETGYKVEFYGPDPITIEPDYSSYSNGYIAGQIAFLANTMNQTIQQARISARETLKGDSGPDTYDGYGKIDVQTVLDEALPVELVSFKGTLTNTDVLLKWQTATEINNYGFEIQRRETQDMKSEKWEKISFVNGHGNSNSPKFYSFIDKNPPHGNIEYRLKQIDFDGAYEYSSILKIANESNADFDLHQNYPNPFNPVTTIKFLIPFSETDNHTTLKVYDLLGNEVAVLVDEEIPAGEHKVRFEAGYLSSGVYFYQLVSGNYISTKKLTLIK